MENRATSTVAKSSGMEAAIAIPFGDSASMAEQLMRMREEYASGMKQAAVDMLAKEEELEIAQQRILHLEHTLSTKEMHVEVLKKEVYKEANQHARYNALRHLVKQEKLLVGDKYASLRDRMEDDAKDMLKNFKKSHEALYNEHKSVTVAAEEKHEQKLTALREKFAQKRKAFEDCSAETFESQDRSKEAEPSKKKAYA